MDSDTPAPSTPKWMLWTGRVLSALPILLLLMSGAMKLSMIEDVKKEFARLGYPESVVVPIAITEIACAVLYAIPQTSVLGAILLTGYLGGATATHVRVQDPFFGPIVVGMIVWGGLVLRDARLRSLLPWRRG